MKTKIKKLMSKTLLVGPVPGAILGVVRVLLRSDSVRANGCGLYLLDT